MGWAAGIALLAWGAASGDVAGAQGATVAFQGSYRAFNAWDGWRGEGADLCTQAQPLQGSEPAAAGRYPVFVYLHGMLADWGGNAEGRLIAQAAAAHGFVAVAASYDSWIVNGGAVVDGNARCVFGGGAGSALTQVCARPKADCSQGVAVAGFSAGGAVAGRAANVSSSVRAAWLLGVAGPANEMSVAAPSGTRALPDGRLRIVVGRRDLPDGGDLSAINRLTGQSCTWGWCLRPDGSGYYVVQDWQVADGAADHCWWMGVNRVVPSDSCTATPDFDPGFRPPSRWPWSLDANLDWLRAQVG